MAAKRSEPFVTASVASVGLLAVSSAQLSFVINSVPACLLSYQTGSGVQDIFSGDVAAEISQLQQVNFTDRKGADSLVNIVGKYDTGDQNLSFPGLVSGPSYAVFAGSVKKSVTIVSPVALLDSLQMGIYQYDHQDMFSVDKLNQGESWAERILAAVEFLMERGFERFKDFSGADRARVAVKHQRNLDLGMPILRKLLEASVPTTKSEGLKQLAAGKDGTLTLNNGIANAILGALMQPAARFWQTLDLLASMFHLIYVPDELYGRLINASEAIDGKVTDVAVAITQVDFSDTGGGVLPVQQVLIRTEAVMNWPVNKDATHQIIDGWPEEPPGSGLDAELPMPGWLIPASQIGPSGVPAPVPVGPPGLDDPLDITSYKGGSNTIVKRARQAANPIVRQFVRDYARSAWIDAALTRSSVAFSVRLTLAVKPGNRYRVTDPLTKKPLFTGFLASVQHAIEVNTGEGGGGTERTSVRFTHVEMGDFKLPGK